MPQDLLAPRDLLAEDSTSPSVSSTSNISSLPAAVVGGIANAGGSMLESGVDAALWATDKMGLTNPDTSNVAKQMAHEGITRAVGSSPEGDQSDPFNRAAAINPIVAKAAEYGEDAGLLFASNPGNIFEGGDIAKTLGNIAAKTVGNSLIGAGISGPDTTSQNLGATVAGLASPVADLATLGIAKGSKAATLVKDQLNNVVAPIITKIKNASGLTVADKAVQAESAVTKAALDYNNALYNQIKSIPEAINPNPIRKQVMGIIREGGSSIKTEGGVSAWDHISSNLDPKQLRVLIQIQQDAGKMRTMEDAVNLRQYIAANSSLFKGSQVSKGIYDGFNSLKTNIDNTISTQAEKAGLKGVWEAANDGYKNVIAPLRDSGALDRLQAVKDKAAAAVYNAKLKPGMPTAPIPDSYAQAAKQIFPANITPQKASEVISRLGPEGKSIMQDHLIQTHLAPLFESPNFDRNAALLKTNQLINKYGEVLGKEGTDTLRGVKAAIEATGATGETGLKMSKASMSYYSSKALAGGIIGGGLGYESNGKEGATLGSLAGLALGPQLLNSAGSILKKMINSSAGQAVLRKIGKNPELIRTILQGGVQAIPAKLSNKGDTLYNTYINPPSANFNQ